MTADHRPEPDVEERLARVEQDIEWIQQWCERLTDSQQDTCCVMLGAPQLRVNRS